MAEGIVTVAQAFKENFYDAAVALFAAADDTKDVHISFGWPGTFLPADICAFGRVSIGQEAATLSATNRSREEELELDVTLSSFIPGGEEAEVIASRRAYSLLGRLEYFARITDTTIGGAVRECFLDRHESDGSTDKRTLDRGRNIFVGATFKAHARISGRGTP